MSLNLRAFIKICNMFIMLITVSCNNDSADATAKLQQDSINKQKYDDSVRATIAKKRYDDSVMTAKNLIDTLKNLGVFKLDTSNLTCDQVIKAVLDYKSVPPEDFLYLMAKASQCNAEAHNQAHPEDPQAVVVYEDPNENKILFNTISLKTGEDIAAAAKKIIGIAVAAKTQNPVLTAAGSIVGSYSVDAYLEAAKKNDPLIVILPTAIPSVKLAKDVYRISSSVYKEATKIHLDAPITVQINAAKSVYSLSQKAADFAEQQGIKTIKVGPIKVPIPNPNPLPSSLKPKDVIKKALCPFC